MHSWDVNPKDAIKIQNELKEKVSLEAYKGEIKLIGGADVSLNLYETTLYAGITVLTYPDFKKIAHSVCKIETKFPYIPGLLSFREIPGLLECWKNLETKPDLVMVDGQGIAHPRRLGIASHFGVLIDAPTIGVAKSKLFGYFKNTLNEKGSSSEIKNREGEIIGHALRSKKNTNPLIISPGHKVSVEQSLKISRKCLLNHKMPEPTRLAHILVNEFRRGKA